MCIYDTLSFLSRDENINIPLWTYFTSIDVAHYVMFGAFSMINNVIYSITTALISLKTQYYNVWNSVVLKLCSESTILIRYKSRVQKNIEYWEFGQKFSKISINKFTDLVSKVQKIPKYIKNV